MNRWSCFNLNRRAEVRKRNYSKGSMGKNSLHLVFQAKAKERQNRKRVKGLGKKEAIKEEEPLPGNKCTLMTFP